MRSRYSAFVNQNEPYLLATWHASALPPAVSFEPATQWLGLTVKATREDGDHAQVEFIARYKVGGASAVRIHERSHFVREGGRWFYVNGDALGRPHS